MKHIPREILDRQRAERRLARASQTYRSFLKDIEAQTQLAPEFAEKFTSSVLCLLEQRLSAEEVKDFEAQLPQQLRTLVHRCAEHESVLPRKFDRQDMLMELSAEFQKPIPHIENWVKAIFRVLSMKISKGEVDDVVMQLPRDMRGLWPVVVNQRIEEEWEKERHAAHPSE